MAEFHWSGPSEKAAQLIAAGNLTVAQIADSVGVARSTVYAWYRHDEFKARVEEHLAEIRAEVRRVGLATVEARVAALNDRWVRMRRVIEARADDPTMRDVPGGPTGLLVRTIKRVVVEIDDADEAPGDVPGRSRPPRKSSREVEEFAVDTGLLKELREHEKQAAQELGQWAEKQHVDGLVKVVVEYADDAQVDAPEAAPGPGPGAPGDAPL